MLTVQVRGKMTAVLITALVAVAPVACQSQNGGAGASGEVFESERASFRLVEQANGLAHPWSLAFLPDGKMLVTERPGKLLILEPDGSRSEVSGLPQISAVGQGGLLDLVLDPDYADNGWIYMTYTSSYQGGVGTTLGRARLDGTRLADFQELFRMQPPGSGGRHFGSRIEFLTDGTLVVSIGDRGAMERAQNTADHAGGIIRLNRDGSVPQDNPFVNDPDVRDELYTIGHRNPQGLALHPETGVLWQHEHGPRGGDELNIIEPGENYGWPRMSQGVDYRTGGPIGEGTEAPGMKQPVAHWSPAIAPSGMSFYFGDRFPAWQGSLFMGSLVDTHLLRLELSGQEIVHQERLLDGVVGRIRYVTEGPDGYLWLLTDHRNGSLYRLEPAD